MAEDLYSEEQDDSPHYQQRSEIGTHTLREAICSLNLLGDDPFLRLQAANLGIVDEFLTDLEYKVLRGLFEEERTPLEAAFLSAQSQMWIFATYEVLRTWRQRAREIIKWGESGGLTQKLAALDREEGFLHFGKQCRAEQMRGVVDKPDRVQAIQDDLKRTHISFVRIEALRVSLAKHEVRKIRNSVALQPGYGRINRHCGALDYEIENGACSLGYISRRDIADELRALLDDSDVPSDEHLASFDEFMRGPKTPVQI